MHGSLSSVLVTPAQKRPFYELSPDTVRDVFYVLSLGPHFCYPIPSFDNSTRDGWGLITLQEVLLANRSKHRPRNSLAKNAMPKCKGRKLLTQQEILCPNRYTSLRQTRIQCMGMVLLRMKSAYK